MLGVIKTNGSERGPSVGPDGNQSSKRSQMTADAPNLKIKRMNKSKNQTRGGSTRPATVVRNEVNQTVLLPGNASHIQGANDSVSNVGHHESLLLRDF